LQVVLKDEKHDIYTTEIVVFKIKRFFAKNIINLINRYKKPQPLFKVELVP